MGHDVNGDGGDNVRVLDWTLGIPRGAHEFGKKGDEGEELGEEVGEDAFENIASEGGEWEDGGVGAAEERRVRFRLGKERRRRRDGRSGAAFVTVFRLSSFDVC